MEAGAQLQEGRRPLRVASVKCPPPRAPLEEVSTTSGLTASVSLARPLKEPATMAVQLIKV